MGAAPRKVSDTQRSRGGGRAGSEVGVSAELGCPRPQTLLSKHPEMMLCPSQLVLLP